jgi:hypothetical protein
LGNFGRKQPRGAAQSKYHQVIRRRRRKSDLFIPRRFAAAVFVVREFLSVSADGLNLFAAQKVVLRGPLIKQRASSLFGNMIYLRSARPFILNVCAIAIGDLNFQTAREKIV